MKRALVIFLAMIIVLTASGCSNYIHQAVALPINNSSYTSNEIAIAVDYSGVKHIARLECPTSGSYPCQLIYTRVRPGLDNYSETAFYYQPLPPYSISDIDIAVTDSGSAIIVFRYNNYLYYCVSNFICYDPIPLDTTYPLTFGIKPLAVARGESLYVVYSVQDGAFSHIRYRRMSPDSTVGGWVDNTSSSNFIPLDAAVGWNGWLYVVYYQGSIIKYADNYLMTGDMVNKFTVDNYTQSTPRIDVNGFPAIVYIIYSQNNPSASDDLYIGHCPADNCTVGITGTYVKETVPLDASANYQINGNPQVIADTFTTVWYAFTATWAGSPNMDVYMGSIQVGPPPIFSSLFQLTNTTEEEIDARICLTFSVNPVVAWREALTYGYYGNIKEFGFYSGSNTVSDTTSGAMEFDFSCNADWGAGIWNEYAGGFKQAWVSFNTYPALMPMIIK